MDSYSEYDHDQEHKNKILMADADSGTLRQVLARSFAEIIALRAMLVEEQSAREEAERGLEEAEVLANDLRRRVEGLEEAVWKAGLGVGGGGGVGEQSGSCAMDVGGANEEHTQAQGGNVHLPSPKESESTGFGFHEEVNWASHPHAQPHLHPPQPHHPHAHPTHAHAPSTAPTPPPSNPSSPNHPPPAHASPLPPPPPPAPTCPNCAIYRSAVDKAAYNDMWLRTAVGHDLSYIHDATSRTERAAKEAREILEGMVGRLGVSVSWQPGGGVPPQPSPPAPVPAPAQAMYVQVATARDVGSDMWGEVYGHVRQENAGHAVVAAMPVQY